MLCCTWKKIIKTPDSPTKIMKCQWETRTGTVSYLFIYVVSISRTETHEPLVVFMLLSCDRVAPCFWCWKDLYRKRAGNATDSYCNYASWQYQILPTLLSDITASLSIILFQKPYTPALIPKYSQRGEGHKFILD